MKNNKALSAYIIEFTSYNKIDVDHAHKYEIESNKTDDTEKQNMLDPEDIKISA